MGTHIENIWLGLAHDARAALESRSQPVDTSREATLYTISESCKIDMSSAQTVLTLLYEFPTALPVEDTWTRLTRNAQAALTRCKLSITDDYDHVMSIIRSVCLDDSSAADIYGMLSHHQDADPIQPVPTLTVI